MASEKWSLQIELGGQKNLFRGHMNEVDFVTRNYVQNMLIRRDLLPLSEI